MRFRISTDTNERTKPLPCRPFFAFAVVLHRQTIQRFEMFSSDCLTAWLTRADSTAHRRDHTDRCGLGVFSRAITVAHESEVQRATVESRVRVGGRGGSRLPHTNGRADNASRSLVVRQTDRKISARWLAWSGRSGRSDYIRSALERPPVIGTSLSRLWGSLLVETGAPLTTQRLNFFSPACPSTVPSESACS